MSSFRLRPRFSHLLSGPEEEVRTRIVGSIKDSGAHCELKSFPGFVCLRVPEDERRFWSPRLHLNLEQQADGNTQVTGLYGPNANMWSSFLYGYLFAGSAALFSGILGGCQASLGMCAWGLWICCATSGICLGMYLTAQLGQKLGARQMFRLHQIYETAVGCELPIR